MMRPALMLAAALLPLGVAAQEVPPPDTGPLPAGDYWIDPAHSRVLLDIDHLSYSRFLLLLPGIAGHLTLDPAAPEGARIEAQVDMADFASLVRDPSVDFDAMLRSPDFLDAGAHPVASFASTAVRRTGEMTAEVTGDLTLRGVTQPVTLMVRFNGGYPGHPMDPGGARIGFSAEGSLLRSAFGMTAGIPLPGTTLGVADEVRFRIETEFTSNRPGG